jgi:predicted DNA-binding transcriptional regulator AlpA
MPRSPAQPALRAALADPAAVGEHLGISEKTLAQWRWRGEGPAYIKIGGAVRYRWESVDAYIASRESAP